MPAAASHVADLSQATRIVEAILDDAMESVREQLGDFLEDLLGRLQRRAPIVTGRFRSSLHPWRGQPGSWQPPEAVAMGYPITGRAEVDVVMAAWLPGQDLGLASNVPYASGLAVGRSKQAPAGWIETEIAGAIAKAEARS